MVSFAHAQHSPNEEGLYISKSYTRASLDVGIGMVGRFCTYSNMQHWAMLQWHHSLICFLLQICTGKLVWLVLQVKAEKETDGGIEDLQKATERAAKEDHKDS